MSGCLRCHAPDSTCACTGGPLHTRERSSICTLHITSWQEQDEHGAWWWKAQHTPAFGSNGPVSQSRGSRQRAISYVLRELADEMRDYDATTKVD